MLRPTPKQSVTPLPESLVRRVHVYSLAAAAAGVGILALTQPADGEVVITRKTIPIPVNSNFLPPTPLAIDLNHDGIKDFSFSIYSFAYHSFNLDLTMWPLEGGAVVGQLGPKGPFYASALMHGGKIGPSAHFSSKGDAAIELAHGLDASSNYSRKLYGNWGGNPSNRYIGVKFLINGQTHYGWVRMTVTTEPRGLSASITAYAYETVANKRIVAGMPENAAAADSNLSDASPHQGRASLGMLALGSDGLKLWRREETVTSN